MYANEATGSFAPAVRAVLSKNDLLGPSRRHQPSLTSNRDRVRWLLSDKLFKSSKKPFKTEVQPLSVHNATPGPPHGPDRLTILSTSAKGFGAPDSHSLFAREKILLPFSRTWHETQTGVVKLLRFTLYASQACILATNVVNALAPPGSQ